MDTSTVSQPQGFIPDNQFTPDQEHAGFVSDDQFVSDEDKYSTPSQQVKTGLEGAAQGVAGPLSTLAETKLLGVNPEDIRGRAEANPLLHGASEAAGLVGGALIPGLGEYSLGTKIAEAGTAASGIAKGSQLASAAIKAASEMALIQASDETSKWLQNDPNQNIQSAIASIGLSAALGGAGAAVFSKAGSALRSLGKEPEQAEQLVKGLRKGLNPLTGEEYTPMDRPKLSSIDPFTKKPVEPKIEMASETPNRAMVKSSTLGKDIAQAILDNAPNAASEGLGAGLGAALGHATGIPGAGWAGALLGERALSPMLRSIIPAIGKRIMDMGISGPGFMSAINAMELAVKGRLLVEKAANSVFQSGIDLQIPSKQEKAALDAKVRTLQNDPKSAQVAIDNNLGHYMPEHAMGLGQTVGNSIQYLNSQRPVEEKQSPLDSKPAANNIIKANYDRALELAQQPLLVMKNIKEGNLTSMDIKHIANMYPALYEQMKTQLLDSMTAHLSKNNTIPYKTRLGLSLFMGQPLDSSMKPQSILASQPAPQQVPQGAPGVKNQKHSMSNINKLASLDATPLQAREANKVKKSLT